MHDSDLHVKRERRVSVQSLLLVGLFAVSGCGNGGTGSPATVIRAPQAVGEEVVTVEAAVGDHLLLRSARIPLHPDFVDAKTAPEFDSTVLRLIGDAYDPKSFGASVRVFEFELLADRPSDVRIVTTCAKAPGDRVARYHVNQKATTSGR